MIVVVDTSVLVSGLLSAHGAPARVIDLLTTGDLKVAYDDRIAIEYRQVLARPLPRATARAARRVRRAGGGPPAPGLPAQAVLGLAGVAEAGVRAYNLLREGFYDHMTFGARPESELGGQWIGRQVFLYVRGAI